MDQPQSNQGCETRDGGSADDQASANDGSAADLDGDGDYELILKWDPNDSKDNSQSGITSDVYLDTLKLDGTTITGGAITDNGLIEVVGTSHTSTINGNASLSGGSVALAGGNSNEYVRLPSGIVSTFENITLETWVTWNGGTAWQRIFDFGGKPGSYMFLTPRSDGGTTRFLRGEQIDHARVLEESEVAEKEGGQGARIQPLLLGRDCRFLGFTRLVLGHFRLELRPSHRKRCNRCPLFRLHRAQRRPRSSSPRRERTRGPVAWLRG